MILVPQGAEYQAVCRGLQAVQGVVPRVISIPVGMQPVARYLAGLEGISGGVLLMGLCGSLHAGFGVGEAVVYQSCTPVGLGTVPQRRECDRPLTDFLISRLHLPSVNGVTCDRVLHLASQKRQFSLDYDTVDMEGWAVLDSLNPLPVAMLRVVSDDSQQDLPDLADTIDQQGNLKPGKLAIAFLRQPLAASRLIRGSLVGLKRLQTVTTQLFEMP